MLLSRGREEREREGEMIQGREDGYAAIDEPEVTSWRRRVRVSGPVLRFMGASFAILGAIVSCECSCLSVSAVEIELADYRASRLIGVINTTLQTAHSTLGVA